MAEPTRDILLGDDGDLIIRGGDLAVGPSLTQEVILLMLTNQGELRHDPLSGCNLRRLSNARITRSALERIIKVQVERDGKAWPDVSGGVKIILNNGRA